MLEDPVEPAGRDARVRRAHAFNERSFTKPIARQPIDGPARYEVDVRPRLVKQRGILDRTLPAADHDDPLSPEAVQVHVLAGVRDEVGWQAAEFLRSVLIVTEADRYHDRRASDHTPVRHRQVELAVTPHHPSNAGIVDMRPD